MRYTYRRGFLWIFLYLVLSSLPLLIAVTGAIPEYRGFWIEFSIALGFIALGMFALQFLFSGRFKWIAPTFGMDNIIQYHREVGIIAFIFLLAHPVILLVTEPNFVSFLDPRVNAPRAIALSLAIIAALFLIISSIWRLTFSLNYEK